MMIHTGPVQGKFTSDVKKSHKECPQCGKFEVYYTTWESDCGGYEDYQYECEACEYVWWVEGPDS